MSHPFVPAVVLADVDFHSGRIPQSTSMTLDDSVRLVEQVARTTGELIYEGRVFARDGRPDPLFRYERRVEREGDTATRRILEYSGRVPPLERVNGRLKALDARVRYTFNAPAFR